MLGMLICVKYFALFNSVIQLQFELNGRKLHRLDEMERSWSLNLLNFSREGVGPAE